MKRLSRGLGGPTPEMIAQAQSETSATIVKIMLTFAGAASFCLLSLLEPDSSLLTNGGRLSVPVAGPVSFLGFMIVGPLILIVLRIYLQIYVELMRRLEPIGQRLHPLRVPTLDVRRNSLLRGFTGFVLYLLLPLTMLAFTWKAAVLAAWIPGLVGVTTAVIVSHIMLLLRWPWRLKIPQRSKILLGLGVVIIPAGAVLVILASFGGELLQRPYYLFRADLSGQWLVKRDLPRAILEQAKLQGANLVKANLQGASLVGANLQGADLRLANLQGANLLDAHLQGANLLGAHLQGADLEQAHLQGALLWNANLQGADLEQAELQGADLRHAWLQGADHAETYLAQAHLQGAKLWNANLLRADLPEKLLDVDLSGTKGLTQAQLDKVCGTNVELPAGLVISSLQTNWSIATRPCEPYEAEATHPRCA